MITTPTVFILGAGASMPYGFPSGKTLVNKICELGAPSLTRLGLSEWDYSTFTRVLRTSQQPSVDAFLEHRSEFMDIGKTLIATVLCECEQENNLFVGEENWYTYLLDRMTEGTPLNRLNEHQVSFVTFNYDRSLEHHLYSTLCSRYQTSKEAVAEVVKKIPIIHVHGQLGYLPWQNPEVSHHVEYGDKTPGAIRLAANGIKIITENMDHSPDFRNAQEYIGAARRIGILGFGYHDVNMKRLNIPFGKPDLKVTGTGFGLTPAERGEIGSKHGFMLTEYKVLEFFRNRGVLLSDFP
jgi:hypothetical protein